MKKYLLALAAFLVMSANVDGQSIVINENEGSPVEISVDGLRSITFDEGRMVATYNDGTTESYVMSEISRLDFEESSGVRMVSLMEGRVSYSASTGLLVVGNAEGSSLSVMDLGGTVVMEQELESPVETVDLSSLQKGVYLLRLDSKTIKIVR